MFGNTQKFGKFPLILEISQPKQFFYCGTPSIFFTVLISQLLLSFVFAHAFNSHLNKKETEQKTD